VTVSSLLPTRDATSDLLDDLLDNLLGNDRAVGIVCQCAGTVPGNLPRTLDELGVNGISFQQCVRNGVNRAGFRVGIDEIPTAPGTRLIDVVNVIQGAPAQ
jgi:hypothetical protein